MFYFKLKDVLHETFAAMRGSMNEINFTTDKPAVLGDTYGAGYQRALQAKYEHDKDNFFENVRANNAIDLPDFLRCAYVYSGNMQLAPYVNRLYEVLEDILAIHLQTTLARYSWHASPYALMRLPLSDLRANRSAKWHSHRHNRESKRAIRADSLPVLPIQPASQRFLADRNVPT